MKIKVVIDRFEGERAVLLAGDAEHSIVWPRQLLPVAVREGDILDFTLAGNRKATRAAHEEAEDLLRRLLNEQK